MDYVQEYIKGLRIRINDLEVQVAVLRSMIPNPPEFPCLTHVESHQQPEDRNPHQPPPPQPRHMTPEERRSFIRVVSPPTSPTLPLPTPPTDEPPTSA